MLNWKKGNDALLESGNKERAKRLVLIVDDEEPNLRQIKGILEREYDVLTSASGYDALEKIKQEGISAIISDQRMPEMTGTELFAEIASRRHAAPRIILTGYAEMSSVVDAINSGHVFRYLTKPVVQEDLLSSVRQAVTQYDVTESSDHYMDMLKGLMEDNAAMAKQLSLSPSSEIGNPFNLQEPQKVDLAILMTDIRNFSQITVNLEPGQIMEILQIVFSRIHRVVFENGGSIDKHMGDTLMAFFGFDGSVGIKSAVRAMKHLAEIAPQISQDIHKQFGFSLQFGMGVAGGEVIVGMLGGDARSELAIIGETVNLAHRLQEVTKLMFKSEAQPAGRGSIRQLLKKNGSSTNCIGVTLPEYVRDLGVYETILLPGDIRVRNFETLETLAVVSS